MEKKELTPKMIRQRKLMLVLPLLALPFLTLIFWSLGGGKIDAAEAATTQKLGFNLALPDANLKDEKPMDKMSYYDQAMQDSSKLKAQQQNDPNLKGMDGSAAASNPYGAGGLNTSLSGNGTPNDPNTENIYRRLELLNKELNRPASSPSYSTTQPYTGNQKQFGNNEGTADVDRLEKMMQAMSHGDPEDPEMKQLNSMLERLVELQHPELVREKLKAKKGQPFSVTTVAGGQGISMLENKADYKASGNGFYSIDDSTAVSPEPNAIEAVVNETQTLVSGSIVKLRLKQEIFINGIRIPKDSFIYGVASLSGERLGIDISNLRYQSSIYPVDLKVFDLDGLEGIRIPGAITRDVAAQSADQSLQNVGINSLDASWGVQAAGAGIEAAKTLFGKKMKLIKVTVKAGYQVFLQNGKEKQASVEINK